MIRVLLLSVLVSAGPLAAQAPEEPTPVRPGTPVRVFLSTGPPDGAAGVLVSGGGDTILVASPTLGLVRLPAADLQRLEAAAGRGRAWKYPAYVVALSGATALIAPPEDQGVMFINGLILFGIAGGIAYLLEPPRRPLRIDPRHGLPQVRQNPARPGVPVRISTGPQPPATLRMHGFTADSLYLFAEGRSTSVARAAVRSLQVSTGHDRRSGAVWGGRIGAAAGGAVALSWLARLGGEGAYLVGPVVLAVGGGMGWLVGAPAGWALAPRRWADVPVHPRQR